MVACHSVRCDAADRPDLWGVENGFVELPLAVATDRCEWPVGHSVRRGTFAKRRAEMTPTGLEPVLPA